MRIKKKVKMIKNINGDFFLVFSVLGLFSVFFTILRIIFLTKGVIRLERTLHKDMIEKLIKAPINLFHEIIPRGQIYIFLFLKKKGTSFTFKVIDFQKI